MTAYTIFFRWYNLNRWINQIENSSRTLNLNWIFWFVQDMPLHFYNVNEMTLNHWTANNAVICFKVFKVQINNGWINNLFVFISIIEIWEFFFLFYFFWDCVVFICDRKTMKMLPSQFAIWMLVWTRLIFYIHLRSQ